MSCQSANLQVSTQITVQVEGVPMNYSNSFCGQLSVDALANGIISVPNGVSPVPIGSLTQSQLGFLYIENLDPAITLLVSTNANGSPPFAQLEGGRHLVLPVVPGTAFYFSLTNGPIEALVLALSS
jgi:hypothetical protein